MWSTGKIMLAKKSFGPINRYVAGKGNRMKRFLSLAVAIISIAWIVFAQEHPGALQNQTPESHSALSQTEHGSMHHGPAMKLEFENEQVQVFRVHIGPHEKIPMHDISGPRVQVLLTDEHLRINFPNGGSKEITNKAGATFWIEPQEHAGENLSDAPLEFVLVVPKTK